MPVRTVVVGAVTVALFAAATTVALAASNVNTQAGHPIGPISPPPHALGGPSTKLPTKHPSATAPTGRFRAAGHDAVANSYIVVLKDAKATQTQVDNAASGLTTRHHGKVDKIYSKALRGFSTTMTEADAKQLAADPVVSYVEQNHIVHSSDTVENTKSPYYDQNNLWGLDRVDQSFMPLDHRYAYSDDAHDVNVYVIDTGVDFNHTEFARNPGFHHGWSATFDADQTAACGTAAPGMDDNGHGTFVAAEITGQTFGVAKLAPIEPVKVLDCKGEGTVDEVVQGIDHVTTTAVRPAVVNMSLGGDASTAIDDAVNASIASGITYVVAAGNENTDACTGSPARAPAAITVGATDATDFRASFSNYGPCVDIFAPGVNIESAYMHDSNGGVSYIGYTYASGTSMASPLAAGDAALLLHAHPAWTPAQVRAAIVGSAITGTVHAAGAGSTTKLLHTGEPAFPTTFGLRSHANNRIVTAESGGAKSLIANRYNVGAWEGFTVVDAGDGTHVALRSSSDNLYVTAESAGNQPLIASRPAIGAWEKFTLVRNDDGSVSLQAAINGKYVTADSAGGQPLIANRTSIGTWEEFDLAGPAATIFLGALADDQVVTADNAGASPLIANRNSVGKWEQFDVVDAGGYAAFLAHANGRFVTAESGGSRPLIASRPAVGAWEKFTLVNNGDGTMSLLANANGRIVTADSAGSKPLIANRNAIGNWEEFVLFTSDELS